MSCDIYRISPVIGVIDLWKSNPLSRKNSVLSEFGTHKGGSYFQKPCEYVYFLYAYHLYHCLFGESFLRDLNSRLCETRLIMSLINKTWFLFVKIFLKIQLLSSYFKSMIWMFGEKGFSWTQGCMTILMFNKKISRGISCSKDCKSK